MLDLTGITGKSKSPSCSALLSPSLKDLVKAIYFFRKETANNCLNPLIHGNLPTDLYEFFSEGKFPHSPNTREEHSQRGESAMKLVPQGRVFEDTEAANSQWTKQESGL